mmetsp:Transcript_30031/g.96911  ORF Transcript_30031/g.96911 Transcript_30031/m.96911 type:complete len:295 (-) Transcript_30031:165-1049(-)|eukprot:CAMPEP_0118900160 /NCGR_PEP_ID=MMETSP1166-20130328/6399_1 /TAXON_ID=1104430 /ORGANISM="Chrysoreinhardia sp, Strain CCMP3193" /LENGTH=294 /DNA_ID=CAMNT_0006839297 /DNA_START=108 /DNA_END=992 /DNA_ORIENTATION=+
MIPDAALIASFALSQLLPHQPVLPNVPMARSFAEYERRASIDAALRRYWEGVDGFKTSDDAAVRECSGPAGNVYGECTADGARAIFDALGLYDDDLDDDLDDAVVFADLGSGVGKLAAQAYVELPSVRKVLAVELAADRDRRAREAWKKFVLSDEAGALAAQGGRTDFDDKAVVFDCADVTSKADLDGVTHCYVANLCFDDDACRRLGQKLFDAKSIVKIAALKSLNPPKEKDDDDDQSPEGPETDDNKARSSSSEGGSTTDVLRQTHRIKASMTWNPAGQAADVFIYQRTDNR